MTIHYLVAEVREFKGRTNGGKLRYGQRVKISMPTELNNYEIPRFPGKVYLGPLPKPYVLCSVYSTKTVR